jgi:ribonuclease inhibitor
MDYILDAEKLQSAESAHPYLKEVLQFPDYYGNNLDALYECLTDICEPGIIRIQMLLPEGSDFYRRLLAVMRDAARENPRIEVREGRGYYVEARNV